MGNQGQNCHYPKNSGNFKYRLHRKIYRKKTYCNLGKSTDFIFRNKILEKIIPELVEWNCGIISGGAHGIDTLSHELTLENNGHTISVFGS